MWIASGRIGTRPAKISRERTARPRPLAEARLHDRKRIEQRRVGEGVANIFWDTNLFIYLFEDHGELGERVVSLRKASIARLDQILTSALTVGEVLVRPVALKAAA